MPSPQSTDDMLLGMMREALGEPTLSLAKAMLNPLATMLRSTLVQSMQPPTAASVAERGTENRTIRFSDFLNSHSVLLAAIDDTFDLSALKPTDAERSALLAASDIVMIDGERRLRLSDAARAEILGLTRRTKLYQDLLYQAFMEDRELFNSVGKDLVRLPSAWLRSFLWGDFANLDNVPLNELKAAHAARERLRLVQDLPKNVPSLEDLSRQIGLAELLEPLRLLIGAQGGWDDTPQRDRFVGRKVELTQLRAFVDELSSKSLAEIGSRMFSKLARLFTGTLRPGLMLVEARGGLGKSTLLAKFVIDHAVLQATPFPFAYLDFDRAGIDPERPRQLLIEIARQVGLQFPRSKPQLDELIADIRDEFARPMTISESSAAPGIKDPFSRFAEILGNSTIFGDRAFLLVLDTLEVVQWNSVAMDKLAELVSEFRAKGVDQLRVVASGRADVPELRRGQDTEIPAIRLQLKPLLVTEARQLAEVLGREALGNDWISSWSSKIAGGTTENDARREPLAVRVAVDLIVHADASKRQKLADEIGQFGFEADFDFVARLYENRIVNHVRDPLARKLAWPGLVVRRVTTEIARDVLAGHCGITPDQAVKAFTALGQEVWMVTREGDALRHRPDLRARTLHLMRRRDPRKFAEISRGAVEYFEKHRERSREDSVEWIYHRLLAGEAPNAIERDLTSDILPLLARAEEDFPQDSLTASYIAARTAKSRLSPRRIAVLLPQDALYHLSVTSTGSFAFDDSSLDKASLDVSDRIADANLPVDSDLNQWARALWIKTGAWKRMAASVAISDNLEHQTLRTHIFWAVRTAATFDVERRAQVLDECFRAVSMHASSQDRVGLRISVQMLALASIARSKDFEKLDQQVAHMLRNTKPKPLPSMQAALRTVIVFGKASRGPALALWLESRRRGSSERVLNPTVSLAELKSLTRIHPASIELLSGIDRDAPGVPMRFTNERIVASAGRAFEEMSGEFVVAPNYQTSRNALAPVFACRDEDWIVPFGYAAARARSGRLSAALSQRLTGYTVHPAGTKARKQSPEPPNDMLSALRLADEASDLVGFTRLVLAECDPQHPATADLRFLLNCRNAWSEALAKTIGTNDIDTQVEPLLTAREQTLLQPGERPPEPKPVIFVADLQKGRWGGQPSRDGRAVRVMLDSVERDVFYFSVIVESTDGTTLQPPVVFHLHDSYPRSVIAMSRIIDHQQTRLSEWNAYGVFTIGIQVKNAMGSWVSLEFDLAQLRGLPKRFLTR